MACSEAVSGAYETAAGRCMIRCCASVTGIGASKDLGCAVCGVGRLQVQDTRAVVVGKIPLKRCRDVCGTVVR